MTPQGALMVNNCLQVKGCRDVFALGDCTNHPTPKLAFIAGLHADYLVENLPKYFAGQPMKPWSDSRPPLSLFLLSNVFFSFNCVFDLVILFSSPLGPWKKCLSS